MNLEVESACSQDCLIYKVKSIGGSYNDNPLCWSESIHLTQELVDSGRGFMGVSEMVHPTAQGINFIDKDNATLWAFSGCCEELSNSFGAYSHIHFLKL